MHICWSTKTKRRAMYLSAYAVAVRPLGALYKCSTFTFTFYLYIAAQDRPPSQYLCRVTIHRVIFKVK